MSDEKKPTEMTDDALDGAQGGAETVHLYLKANDTQTNGESGKVVRSAGLRSDGELVQAKTPKGGNILKS